MLYDRTIFFNYIRQNLANNKNLTQTEVDGFNLLLAEGERRNISTDWIAYILATTWWETAYTMQPIKEYGSQAYLQAKKYYPYYGRGYVQLTWDYNYRIMGKWIGVDLLSHPELALVPANAVKVIYEGMIRGMFTAKKLSDYLDGNSVTETDEQEYQEFIKARSIVNGQDRATTIAKYALTIEKALVKAQTVKVEPTPNTPLPQPTVPVVVGPPPNKEPIPVSNSKPIWTLVSGAILSVVGVLNSLNPIVQGIFVVCILFAAGYVGYKMINGGMHIEGIF